MTQADPDARQTGEDLLLALQQLGLERGRDLIVHSALSKLGFVEGGRIPSSMHC